MRPSSKAELLDGIDREKATFIVALEEMPEERRTVAVIGEWSPKDLVAHLAAWERLFLGWYECAAGGEEPDVPATGYTWAQEDRLNDDIFRAWQGATWEDVLTRWSETSAAARDVIASIPEVELFEARRYRWSGGTTLGVYAWECTGGHYAWARAELEKVARR